MKCPKCGAEISRFDLHPNCKHCGVNILYYTSERDLARDAKRRELESASTRMILMRLKASTIGGKVQIAQLVWIVVALATVLVPFGKVTFTLPLAEEYVSAGAIGVYQLIAGGFWKAMLSLAGSEVYGAYVKAAFAYEAMLVIGLLLLLPIGLAMLLTFINLDRGLKFVSRMSFVAICYGVLVQSVAFILPAVLPKTELAHAAGGFGGAVYAAVCLVAFFLNRSLRKNGIPVKYREYDPKRVELLKKLKKNEISVDDLSLPVFESDEEREERLKELKEALKAEEEAKEL